MINGENFRSIRFSNLHCESPYAATGPNPAFRIWCKQMLSSEQQRGVVTNTLTAKAHELDSEKTRRFILLCAFGQTQT